MTKSELPEITLTCGDGHPFTTRAAGGQTVRCKECQRSKHVPTDRPRTAKEAAAYNSTATSGHQDQAPASNPGADQARKLAARWQAETPWSAKRDLTPRPGRDQDSCPGCGDPMLWEPRRTLTFCPECQKVDLPPAVSEHYRRQASQRSETAVMQRVDPMAEKAARARLRALISQTEQWANDWIDSIGDEDSYDRIQWKREAGEFAAILRGYIPEIRNSETQEELAEIKSHITSEILNSELGTALRTEYDQARNRAENRAMARQRAAEIEQAEAEAEAEADRQRAIMERSQQEVRQVATQRAITSGKGPSYADGFASVAMAIERQRVRTALAIEQRGQCAFKHPLGPHPADRLYGVPDRDYQGAMTGYSMPQSPQLRACSKHFGAAEAELNRQGYPDLTWWDLNGN